MSAVSLIAIGASLLLLILRWRFPKDYGRLTCPWVGIQSNGSALGRLKASVLSLGKRRTLLTQANEKVGPSQIFNKSTKQTQSSSVMAERVRSLCFPLEALR